ncbi:hypothetical protein PPYR_13412 [Photinus pyralis]|uniref:Ankyrin repeat domain-containing protein n=1 Tax=Photinus pyralis TaxID=7054 RepID=A0A5N4A8Z7_PHOPY|nr:ankyrin repeat domain-containing protein 13C-like isoform X2 [Photinus pyralis]KAB0793792.1 hypothetical protein PPYR_13412 [Photinus pyralis]
MTNSIDKYDIHKAVFQNDLDALSRLLETHDVAEKDRHGNTALHLAVMLGREECVQMLLNHNAPVEVENGLGWTVLEEAVSYGNRPTIASLLRKCWQQSREEMESTRPNLMKAFNQIGDFYMELRWDLQSWVPLVSHILPSDICKVYKCGANIRVDMALVYFSDMVRGDISFIFNGNASPNQSLTVLDNTLKVYQTMKYEESKIEIEDEVDAIMSTEISAMDISTKNIHFIRARSGWIFQEDKKELVAGQYQSELYSVHGLVLESRIRKEHLSHDALRKNKALFESFRKLFDNQNIDDAPARRASLSPPPDKNITWEDYLTADVNNYPQLGRERVCKESKIPFKATIAMSRDFPLSVETLLDVLEGIMPIEDFSKLRDFITSKLPSGFPVKLEIPVLPTVTAIVTCQRFEFRNNMASELFTTPKEYTEDPTIFP